MTEKVTEKLNFDDSLDAAKELIRRTLFQSDELISDVTRYLTLKEGKNLRAMLLLASAMDGEGLIPKNAVVAAATLEILHLATLVHDDVIDDSETRRGRSSVQKKFGKKTAVICGDYLFCKCFAMVAEASADYPEKFRDISRAMTKICLGELRQFKHNRDLDLSVYKYLKIIAGKTSALFSLSMYAGAVIGGKSEKQARLLGRIGHHIGMLFQIADDCMDYQADFETAGKSIKHDLLDGVVTLPLIYSLAGNPRLRERVAGRAPTKSGIREIIAEVVSSGGVAAAMDTAGRYFKKAEKLIERVECQNNRLILTRVLEKVSGGLQM